MPPVREVVVAETPETHGEAKLRGSASPLVQAKPPLFRSTTKTDGTTFSAGRLAAVKDSAVKESAPVPRKLAKWDEPTFKSERLLPTARVLETAALQAVPEIRFESPTTKAELMQSFGRIVEQHKKGSDAFVDALVKERTDLAGLPFLKGDACKLSTKQEQALGRSATVLRQNLELLEEQLESLQLVGKLVFAKNQKPAGSGPDGPRQRFQRSRVVPVLTPATVRDLGAVSPRGCRP